MSGYELAFSIIGALVCVIFLMMVITDYKSVAEVKLLRRAYMEMVRENAELSSSVRMLKSRLHDHGIDNYIPSIENPFSCLKYRKEDNETDY